MSFIRSKFCALRFSSDLQRQVDDVFVGHAKKISEENDRFFKTIGDHDQIKDLVHLLDSVSEKENKRMSEKSNFAGIQLKAALLICVLLE